MQTITIDIINNKALKLLQDLESLQLIRLRKEKKVSVVNPNEWATKYKGAMNKQSNEDIENQLKELRNEWQ